MAITFIFQHPVNLPIRRKLKILVGQLFDKEKTELDDLNIVFCSDEFLLDINRRYLSHDYYTDIITFNLSEGIKVTGEIYISVETAKTNSKLYNSLLVNELCRLIVHGCLHLCGYDDKNPSQKSTMTKLENRYLSHLVDL